ncbi:DUF6544 family protein [Winogradskyella schleiferi]|uniref:DUF6544 family protein n=1 Tax=Winogradskyella schleiferi TaxID=2686078 RepID=UPI0015B7EAC5|nr:DUF6544 family protein [Winogradskyella schleiferi]
MRYVFAILLGFHGLIHLMGFISAFFSTSMEKQLLGISKSMGLLWLVAFILFFVSAIQFLGHKKWFYLAFIAVLFSQILIMLAWKDAKFGTLINVIIVLVAISAFGNYQFKIMVQKESEVIILENRHFVNSTITKADLIDLPEIVQLWLINSGTLGHEVSETVQLKQTGTMRTKPNGKWMSFKAQQYFNVTEPSFVWATTVDAMPLISMIGRDKLVNGKGAMLIKLAGLFPIVNVSDNDKVNSGSMIRYLSEMCWFPSAALNDYISWELMDSSSAKATFKYNNETVSGLFTFTENGELLNFEAKRYYGGDEDSTLESWLVETQSFKEFNGIKIPNKSTVTWKLKDCDFHWLTVEIIDLEYNVI